LFSLIKLDRTGDGICRTASNDLGRIPAEILIVDQRTVATLEGNERLVDHGKRGVGFLQPIR